VPHVRLAGTGNDHRDTQRRLMEGCP
jgi:hypothetical protein